MLFGPRYESDLPNQSVYTRAGRRSGCRLRNPPRLPPSSRNRRAPAAVCRSRLPDESSFCCFSQLDCLAVVDFVSLGAGEQKGRDAQRDTGISVLKPMSAAWGEPSECNSSWERFVMSWSGWRTSIRMQDTRPMGIER